MRVYLKCFFWKFCSGNLRVASVVLCNVAGDEVEDALCCHLPLNHQTFDKHLNVTAENDYSRQPNGKMKICKRTTNRREAVTSTASPMVPRVAQDVPPKPPRHLISTSKIYHLSLQNWKDVPPKPPRHLIRASKIYHSKIEKDDFNLP